jgi:hypothetical protein
MASARTFVVKIPTTGNHAVARAVLSRAGLLVQNNATPAVKTINTMTGTATPIPISAPSLKPKEAGAIVGAATSPMVVRVWVKAAPSPVLLGTYVSGDVVVCVVCGSIVADG